MWLHPHFVHRRRATSRSIQSVLSARDQRHRNLAGSRQRTARHCGLDVAKPIWMPRRG